MIFKISIIIPVYKVEQYIQECLESVANQTMTKGVECIIVDDCGRDRSIEIAETFISSYKGDIVFSIIKHEKNKGLSAARNTAINKACGKYVYFLDSDDYIFPETIEKMLGLVDKYPGVDIVQGFHTRLNYGEEPFTLTNDFPEFTSNKKWIRSRLCDFRITDAACNRLIRKDLITDNSIYFEEGYTQEDTIWVYDIQRYISSIAFCKEFTYYYRYTPNSIMTSLSPEKYAADYARVHNLNYKKMRNSKIHPCEVKYLAKVAVKIYRSIGVRAISLLDNKDNFLFVFLYRVRFIRYSSKSFVVKLVTEIVCRLMYSVLSNKMLFSYKIH